MTITPVLDDLDRNPWPKAADVIDEVGWTQGTLKDAQGRVCLTGAIRECAPVPGDWSIITEVARHRNHAEGWNDVPSRRKGQVTGWLRKAKPIDDDELLAVFGPQWEHVVAMVRRFASATDADQQAYRTDCWSLWSKTSTGYRAAYYAVVVYSGPCDAALRALGAFVGYGDVAVVASALARRHEIGTPGGIRQEDYDTLAAPWVKHFGPVHPEDVG